jgi:hypothetical protein
MKVTFRDKAQYSSVLVEKRVVGYIYQTIGGSWFYQPKGVTRIKNPQMFKTREECKKSLS